MLRQDQKTAIRQGFDVGFTDALIARSVADINHMQVYAYRHKLKIPTQEIVNRRYDIWTALIYQGVDIGQVAEMYKVTEQSIKVLLWKNRNISLVEAKAKVLKMRRENRQLMLRSGIPSLDDLGLRLGPIVPDEQAL